MNFFKNIFRHNKQHIAVIDDFFPQKIPFGFRNKEINLLLKNIDNLHVYAIPKISIGDLFFSTGDIGIRKKYYKRNLREYLKLYPENKNRISYLPKHPNNIKLAFCYFLLNTYCLLPYFEKHNIPFVFVLYPGGGFGLNNSYIDRTLKRIFESPCFKRVIVTEPCTQAYLKDKKLCPVSKIDFAFASCVQFSRNEIPKEKYYYKRDKDSLDICFVAMRYTFCGLDKGYDLFIDACKKLLKEFPQTHLHIVGNWNDGDKDLFDIQDNVTMYGVLPPQKLKDLYKNMDVCIAPSRSNHIYDGNFDGFPLGFECMCFGTVLFTTDEFNNNQGFFDEKNIVIIKPDVNDIYQHLLYLAKNPNKIAEIGIAGQKRVYELCDPDERVKKLISILEQVEQ